MDSLGKITLIVLLFFVGCSGKKEAVRLVCPYCSENYIPGQHIAKQVVGGRVVETCWGEIRRATREGIENNTLHYKGGKLLGKEK